MFVLCCGSALRSYRELQILPRTDKSRSCLSPPPSPTAPRPANPPRRCHLLTGTATSLRCSRCHVLPETQTQDCSDRAPEARRCRSTAAENVGGCADRCGEPLCSSHLICTDKVMSSLAFSATWWTCGAPGHNEQLNNNHSPMTFICIIV